MSWTEEGLGILRLEHLKCFMPAGWEGIQGFGWLVFSLFGVCFSFIDGL